MTRIQILLLCLLCTIIGVSRAQTPAAAQPRVIELIADKDSRYRQGKTIAPTIELAPGEEVILRVTALRAKQVARDGSIHGLALLDKDEKVVPGWRFYFHPGVQDIPVKAPAKPGRYSAVCIVICSDMHDAMGFTVVVSDQQEGSKE